MTEYQEELDRLYRIKYLEMKKLIQQVARVKADLEDGELQLKYLKDKLQEITGMLIRMNNGEIPDDLYDTPPADYENFDQREYGAFNVHHS